MLNAETLCEVWHSDGTRLLTPGRWYRKVCGVPEEIYFVGTRADAEPMFRVEAFITGKGTSFIVVRSRL